MKITLAELERIAEALAVRVSYDDLKTSKGGSCRVMESRRIMINKYLATPDKISLLARELAGFDLNGLNVPDNVLKKIRHEAERHSA
jgi:hypothetical protein